MEKKHLPEIIHTKRLTLKRNSIENIEEIYNLLQSDIDKIKIFLPWFENYKDKEKFSQSINNKILMWNNHEYFEYMIFENDNFIGNFCVLALDWVNEHCALGYWLLSKYEGHGYVTEALKAVEKKCFELGFNRIEIRCSPTNEKSIKIPLKCEYKFQGRLEQNYKTLDGFDDTLIYSKLKCNLNKK